MKILHVVTTLDVGGAEMHLLSQVRGQCARGHSVRMVFLKGEGRLTEDFLAAGAEWVGQVPATRPFGLWSHLRWAELVHSHLLKADVLTAVMATLAGRRRCLVSGKHNDEQVLKRPLVGAVHAVIGRLPRLTIVLSDHVGRFVERYGHVPLRRQARVYYGLDPEPFERAAAAPFAERMDLRAELGLGRGDVVFTCVARFAPQKAHDVLLRGFAAARKSFGPRLRLLLVGDDPFGDGRQRAEAVAAELGLGDAVVFAGIRRDVAQILAASDVFVMASLWEGLGLVFLEAMATSLPVLATDVSAVPEVVVDGQTGVLVPPSDAEALARAMAELAQSADRRHELGRAGHLRVLEHFGLDRMVDETLHHYESVARSS
ncbi:glycosyltransferase [Engelhardtia mirabilis]|uniref:GDP-mannose-dependent alpha-(1-6)-phosphatidylinositol monomannoside mannosyltransferase n=1 Tax=Engelhardtia mirabilis TaxID=2528011 RepID=A0A518BKA4_9BACT|nr:GDP-mannose-dependent alpha-(1-6)-phosphatidylinositol monomannoside mannosyltransferase [Planctomycetes bacterium Pla133]QDV01699.1 GDP-mannose-dependent alpha-(1-6)-phosphatidylinositol monomannoside mannosyltransferase [Planctomycetes bacterium Pla86]